MEAVSDLITAVAEATVPDQSIRNYAAITLIINRASEVSSSLSLEQQQSVSDYMYERLDYNLHYLYLFFVGHK